MGMCNHIEKDTGSSSRGDSPHRACDELMLTSYARGIREGVFVLTGTCSIAG